MAGLSGKAETSGKWSCRGDAAQVATRKGMVSKSLLKLGTLSFEKCGSISFRSDDPLFQRPTNAKPLGKKSTKASSADLWSAVSPTFSRLASKR